LCWCNYLLIFRYVTKEWTIDVGQLVCLLFTWVISLSSGEPCVQSFTGSIRSHPGGIGNSEHWTFHSKVAKDVRNIVGGSTPLDEYE
jgi:hypothetical protein